MTFLALTCTDPVITSKINNYPDWVIISVGKNLRRNIVIHGFESLSRRSDESNLEEAYDEMWTKTSSYLKNLNISYIGYRTQPVNANSFILNIQPHPPNENQRSNSSSHTRNTVVFSTNSTGRKSLVSLNFTDFPIKHLDILSNAFSELQVININNEFLHTLNRRVFRDNIKIKNIHVENNMISQMNFELDFNLPMWWSSLEELNMKLNIFLK